MTDKLKAWLDEASAESFPEFRAALRAVVEKCEWSQENSDGCIFADKILRAIEKEVLGE